MYNRVEVFEIFEKIPFSSLYNEDKYKNYVIEIKQEQDGLLCVEKNLLNDKVLTFTLKNNYYFEEKYITPVNYYYALNMIGFTITEDSLSFTNSKELEVLTKKCDYQIVDNKIIFKLEDILDVIN